MNVQETRSPNELRRKNEARKHENMAGFSEAPHFRDHSARRINRFVMQQTRWSPQCTPNCASSRSTAHVATTPWTSRQRPGRNGTSVSSCIAPLGGTVVFLGCSIIRFQTLCCTHPTLGLPSSLPSLSPPKVGNGGTSLIFCN